MTTSVPFSKIRASDTINARAASKEGIDELASSIEQKGLIQALAVRPGDDGTYEVIDGRRRFAAIARLVKAKSWKKDAPVPVLIRNEDDAEALETSLMANTVRLPMHPVDQHAVFTRLAVQGRSDADIAARFGITERTVRQHKALGALAPAVLEAWRKGKLDADAAKAFTIEPRHELQEAALARVFKRPRYGKEPVQAYAVRDELGESRTRKSAVAEPVLARYQAAGGTFVEDLFEDASYVEDGALLKQAEAEWVEQVTAETRARLASQGWAWVAVDDDLPHEWRWDWDKIRPPHAEMSEADQERVDKITEDIDAARDAEDDARADTLENEVEAIEHAHLAAQFTPEQRARSGAVISVNRGSIAIAFGIVRPSADGTVDIEDAIDRAEPAEDEAGEQDDEAGEQGGEEDALTISGALHETITEAQTRAVAHLVKEDFDLALRLAIAGLRSRDWSSPVKMQITQQAHARPPADLEFPRAWAAIKTKSQGDTLAEFAALISGAMSCTVLAHAPSPAKAVAALVESLPADKYLFCMREAFDAANYFSRVTKAIALAAIEEMREAGAAGNLAPEDVLAGMKKPDLATAAAEAAKACGWLPPELRHPAYTLEVAA